MTDFVLSDDNADLVVRDLTAVRNRVLAVEKLIVSAPRKQELREAANRCDIALARFEAKSPPPPPVGVVVTPDTIAAALSRATMGDTLVLQPGTYRLPLVTGKVGVTFLGQPGVVCVAGPDGSALSIRDSADLVFQKMHFRDAVGATSTAVYGQSGALRIRLEGCEIGPTPRQGVFTERTTSGWQIIGCHIHDCYTGNDPNRIHGLYLEGPGHLVEGCVIERIEAFGVQVYPYARNVTVRGTTIRGCGAAGVIVGGDVSGTLIESCRFESPMRAAVESYKLTGGSNVVRGCSANFAGAFPAQAGITYSGNVAGL